MTGLTGLTATANFGSCCSHVRFIWAWSMINRQPSLSAITRQQQQSQPIRMMNNKMEKRRTNKSQSTLSACSSSLTFKSTTHTFPPFSCAFRLHSNFFCTLQLHDNKRKLATRCIKASIDWDRPRLHFNEQRSINLRSREKRVVCYYSFSFSRIHRMLSRQNHHKFVEMAGCELFSRSWIHLNLLICRRSHDSLAASACAFWIMLADSWLKLPNE